MHKRVLNCLTNKRYKGIPIWFMRQAGRHLPEFKNIRDKNPNFISLCLNSKLSGLTPTNLRELQMLACNHCSLLV